MRTFSGQHQTLVVVFPVYLPCWRSGCYATSIIAAWSSWIREHQIKFTCKPADFIQTMLTNAEF